MNEGRNEMNTFICPPLWRLGTKPSLLWTQHIVKHLELTDSFLQVCVDRRRFSSCCTGWFESLTQTGFCDTESLPLHFFQWQWVGCVVSCLCTVYAQLNENPRLWTKPFCFQAFKMLDVSKLCPRPLSPFVFLVNKGHMSADFSRASSAPWATEMRISQCLDSLRNTGTEGLWNVNWNKACRGWWRVIHMWEEQETERCWPGVFYRLCASRHFS